MSTQLDPLTEAKGTRALITGASSGIGEALARVFSAKGHSLILVARRADRLQALTDELSRFDGDVVPIAMDLSERKSPRKLYKQVGEKGLEVDILVNNAGITYAGAFSSMPAEEVQRMLQLNATTLTMLSRLFLDDMLERKFGRILNVSSISAFQPVPSLALYAATKVLVLSLTEALSEELKGSQVKVSALCPGLTDTSMLDSMEKFDTSLPDFMVSSVSDVAREGYEACMRGQVIKIPGVANRLGTLWTQYQPRWLLRTLSGVAARQLLKS